MRFVHDYLAGDTASRNSVRDQINSTVRGTHQSEIKLWTTEYSSAAWREHPLVDDTGWKEVTYEIMSGDISEHLGEAIAREMSFQVASEYWDDPLDALEELSPYRTMVAAARGVLLPQGRILWVPLGVYRVWSVSTGGSGGSTQISVQSYSMEVQVREARFINTPVAGTGPSHVGATSIGGVIQKLLDAAFPKDELDDFVPYDVVSDGLGIGPEDYLFPAKTILTDDRDRLELILRLQDDRNVWGRFDRANHYRIDTMPVPSDEPVSFPVDTGDKGVLVSYSKEFTRDHVYNAVLCFGEYGATTANAPKKAVSWLAVDGPGVPFWNPDSPTAWDGPYGYVPRFQRVDFLPNNATQATQIVRNTAESILARSLDFKAGISFDAVPNPLLEAGDVVEVHFPTGLRFGQTEPVVEQHLITSLSIGLGADSSFSADTIATVIQDAT